MEGFDKRLTVATTEAIQAFLSWYSGDTYQTYWFHLRIFTDWCCANNIDPLAIKRFQVESFAQHCALERNNSVGTVKRRIAALRSFYNICVADEIIRANPVAHVRLPTQYKESLRVTDVYLDRYELNQLLTVAKQQSSGEAGLVAVMGLMGLRVEEAIGLQIGCISEHDGHNLLTFVGKGHKLANLAIPPQVLRLLHQAQRNRSQGSLFIRKSGKAYEYRAVCRMLERLRKLAHINKHISPHTLRRSFASIGLDAGVSIRDMQTAGRWADSRMVSHYDKSRHALDRAASYAIASFVSAAA